MPTVNDWASKAAKKIIDEEHEYLRPKAFERLLSRYSAIISLEAEPIERKAAQFEDNVAYMPVPRCETCREFRLHEKDPELGVCLYLNQYVLTKFGCVNWEEK